MQHPGIELIRSGIHGTGVRANKPFAPGERVIEYVGRKLTTPEADAVIERQLEVHERDPTQGAVYVFEIDEKLSIDGNVPENLAKYINHSCDPNCEVEIIGQRIFIVAKKTIAKGEELTYNYGFTMDDLTDFRDFPCRCGSPRCVGYILAETEWPLLQEVLKTTP